MTVKITDATMRKLLIGSIAIGGVLMALLSLVPWMNVTATMLCIFTCHDTRITGLEINGLTDFGDGYIVAAFGVAIAVLATGLSVLPAQARILAAAVALAALGGVTFAGYNAFNYDTAYFEPTLALHSAVAIPIVVALCASLLAGHQVPQRGGGDPVQ